MLQSTWASLRRIICSSVAFSMAVMKPTNPSWTLRGPSIWRCRPPLHPRIPLPAPLRLHRAFSCGGLMSSPSHSTCAAEKRFGGTIAHAPLPLRDVSRELAAKHPTSVCPNHTLADIPRDAGRASVHDGGLLRKINVRVPALESDKDWPPAAHLSPERESFTLWSWNCWPDSGDLHVHTLAWGQRVPPSPTRTQTEPFTIP